MIERNLEKVLLKRSTEYPVVTLTGPRQSGKTTLVRKLFSDHTYVNLEDTEARLLAQRDPKGFFSRYPAPVIVDEFQRVPELASTILVNIDANRKKKGQYILTGSHQPLLQQAVSQTLAGRTALLRLLPFSINELRHVPRQKTDVDALILQGGMPEVCTEHLEPHAYYRNYFQTYIERDVRQLMEIRNLPAFERFIVLLAGRVGQLVNLSGLSTEVGVSHTTLSGWLSLLEASFVIFRLQPFFSNISKRVVRSPKLYFTETGLAAYLLGLENEKQVMRDPLRGQLFENLIVTELLKARVNKDADPQLYFLRTEKGFEIDIIHRQGSELIPIEIKSSMSYHPDFVRNLKTFCETEKQARNPLLIYAGDSYPSFEGVRCLNYLETSGFDDRVEK
jgi:predicted AAA+ superfamily ATPase